ncbi:hypothetical protein CAEBREN_21346 [Caenorhabditis brenneri]|uniref:Uncharacterized protein n=1 Tax=Caenorhabditis brenneri TaxID=135651 RepID=G0MJ22_CAEBE|nr:hypothetical protein CAEBREN_21346 [Caenorhabditis brenneri]
MMNQIIERPKTPPPDFRKSFLMYRRPQPKPAKNTDEEVDCTPYEHVHYRPYCQTVWLEKRRKAYNKPVCPRMPVIMENLCMFEWLHRVGAQQNMTNEELLFILTNGLYHQNGGNVAIVFNKDHKTGKSATSQMDATFGVSDNAEDALREFLAGQKAPKVKFTIPESLKKYGVGTLLRHMANTEPPVSECYPSTSSQYCSKHQREVEVVTLD